MMRPKEMVVKEFIENANQGDMEKTLISVLLMVSEALFDIRDILRAGYNEGVSKNRRI